MNSRERPLLILPDAVVVDRGRLGGGGADIEAPSVERQSERLAPRFQRLQEALDAQRALVLEAVAGEVPELVVVLEVAGTLDEFFNAVRRVPGAEWLVEHEISIEPDEDFYLSREDHRDRSLGGQLFLVMTDQRAVDEIVSLWRAYEADPQVTFDYGLAKWKTVFAHLRDLRPWDVSDRLDHTGVLEDWQRRVDAGEEVVPTEIELWFRNSGERRDAAEAQVSSFVEDEGGAVVASTVVEEISYHGILAHLPADAVRQLARLRDTRLVRSQDVMLFRAVGQTLAPSPREQGEPPEEESAELPGSPGVGAPVVALLDGMPIENHALLAGRLVIDDPDGWAENYPVAEREHGTAMASLIINGELDATPLNTSRPIYARPILRPDERDFRAVRVEAAPDDELLVDLIHRAVRRIVEGDDGEDPAAATVRVVNLSVCDAALPFDRFPSPLARLLDWLSVRYGLLFIVSAGNYGNALRFELSASDLDALTVDELEAAALVSLAEQGHLRRIYAPAEAINALTVGASHCDSSHFSATAMQRNLFNNEALPSPINAVGGGFRRAIKPELLFPGGRQTYMDTATSPTSCECSPNQSSRAPGARVAAPGGAAAIPAATWHVRGTSVAAAGLAGKAQELYEAIVEPLTAEHDAVLAPEYEALVLKALVSHGASWSDVDTIIGSAVMPDADANAVKDRVARLAGYGATDTRRAQAGEDHRAVLLGWGSLGEDLAHLYEIPLPQSMSGVRGWRRVTVTLAWFSPINPRHRAYRRAALWFDIAEVERNEFGVARRQAQWQAVRRGTLQHEILEGETAAVFAADDSLSIRVNCRGTAGGFENAARYAMAVTVENAPALGVAIYDEIALRIRPRVPVTPGRAT